VKGVGLDRLRVSEVSEVSGVSELSSLMRSTAMRLHP
jgi:hypothetical protein